MAWLLDMTRAEKEQYVIELYKQNGTVREIAKLMHMSFGEIGKILKKFKKEAEIERGHTDVEEIDNRTEVEGVTSLQIIFRG